MGLFFYFIYLFDKNVNLLYLALLYGLVQFLLLVIQIRVHKDKM